MKVLIVYASRYGSTQLIAEWIKERLILADVDADVFCADEAQDPKQYDAVVLGSGVYAHKLLPELEKYINDNLESLQYKKTAVFGVAMRTETFFKNGHAYGGPMILEKLGMLLGGKCAVGKILGGEIIFEKLSEKDRTGLEKFYSSVGLSEMEKAERKIPRTLINKKQVWDFAEEVIDLLNR